MTTRIPATRLARGLGDVLGRIRYRGESFVIERNGVPVAKIGPIAGGETARLREVIAVWTEQGSDPELADDLEAVGAADEPPRSPWA